MKFWANENEVQQIILLQEPIGAKHCTTWLLYLPHWAQIDVYLSIFPAQENNSFAQNMNMNLSRWGWRWLYMKQNVNWSEIENKFNWLRVYYWKKLKSGWLFMTDKKSHSLRIQNLPFYQTSKLLQKWLVCEFHNTLKTFWRDNKSG